MIKCLLSRPGLIAGPLHSTPLQIISQSIPRLDPIDSKSSFFLCLPGSSTDITTENLIVTMDHGSEDPIPDMSGQ